MEINESHLLQDIDLSFRLFEFCIRTMCYAERGDFNIELFCQDIQLNFEEGNVAYNNDLFKSSEDIILASQMSVGAAFGSTAICLDKALGKEKSDCANFQAIKKFIGQVRNAFAHSIAAPSWYVKSHNLEAIDLSFISGPTIDLNELNGCEFEYSQIGGLEFWYKVKDYATKQISDT